MTKIYPADIINGHVVIDKKTIDKKVAQQRIRQGSDVYTTKSQAHTCPFLLMMGKAPGEMHRM